MAPIYTRCPPLAPASCACAWTWSPGPTTRCARRSSSASTAKRSSTWPTLARASSARTITSRRPIPTMPRYQRRHMTGEGQGSAGRGRLPRWTRRGDCRRFRLGRHRRLRRDAEAGRRAGRLPDHLEHDAQQPVLGAVDRGRPGHHLLDAPPAGHHGPGTGLHLRPGRESGALERDPLV